MVPFADPAPIGAAAREYEFAMLALVQGHYRHAFTGLRLCLELCVASVYFATHRLELQEWLDGRTDILWARMLDLENGVLSKRFARAFYPDLADDVLHYNTLARTTYRECSEYVHGAAISHALLSEALAFNDSVFDRWHSLADTVAMVVSFTLSMAFLRQCKDDQLNQLESSVLDRVGHIAEIRAVFGGVVEPK
jgi:hypothetical protein